MLPAPGGAEAETGLRCALGHAAEGPVVMWRDLSELANVSVPLATRLETAIRCVTR